MRKLWAIGLSAAIFLVSLSFAPREDMPTADAGEFWGFITKSSPYKEWNFWDDHADMQPGRAPHGPFHRVYVNDILLNADGVPAPYGSIQVKESFNNDKQLMNITVMYKLKDFNPSAGDWWWAKYDLDGKAGPAGKVQGCIGCHGVRADNDYILVHDLK